MTFEAKLQAFVDAKRVEPFCWGVNDCALFAADWVQALTGHDPAGANGLRLRGRYATPRQALRACRQAFDGPSIANLGLLPGGWVPVPPPSARRGAVLALPVRKRFALGVCLGRLGAWPGPAGFTLRPTLESTYAWNPPPSCLK